MELIQEDTAQESKNGRPHNESVHTLIMKGGGVKGLAFAGAIEVLNKAGYRFDTFVGTSAGAIAAVLLAAGYSPHDLQKILCGTPFNKFIDARWPQAIYNILVYGGMCHGKWMTNWMEDLLRKKFPDIALITMGDLRKYHNRAIIFASHPVIGTLTFDSDPEGENRGHTVADAVRLSASIPGLFVPKEHSGHRIYDGGLLNNFPVEVYQRVQNKESKSTADDEDFIALYIGKKVTSSNDARWWGFEALKIMLSRDDRIILQTHRCRSLILDTTPIGTADFRISDVEKEYLIEVGREAALRYLGYPECEDKNEKLSKLRVRVDSERKKRTLWRSFKFITSSIAVVAIVTGLSSLVKPAVQYEIISDPRYRDTYINQSSVVKRLGNGAIAELGDTYKIFAPSMANDVFHFDSFVQIVVTGDQYAIRLLVLEGVLQEEIGITTKIISSVQGENTPIQSENVFVKNDEVWNIPEEHCWWEEDLAQFSEKVRRVLKSLNMDSCIQPNQRFRIVVTTKYPGAFSEGENVTPWVLWAHRLLQQNDQSIGTYLFLPDPENTVRYPHRIYSRKGQRDFVSLSTPSSSIYTKNGWIRVNDTLEFLRTKHIRTTVEKDPKLKEALKIVEEAVEKAYGTFRKRDLKRKNLLFEFDVAETRKLDPDAQNLVVFAEALH